MKKPILSLILLLLSFYILTAQSECNIFGIIKDSGTNETLANATILIVPLNKGVISNSYGKYTTNIKSGTYTATITYLGYHKLTKHFTIKENTELNFNLIPLSIQVKNIDIIAKKSDNNVRSADVGTISLDRQEIEKLPSFLGAPDIIKTIKLTPGIQGGGEGNSGLFVRGGDAGQNLIILDNMPLYNPSHLLGAFSVFNADAVNGLKLIKGGIPANYGGKASSVIDIRMKEGSYKKMQGSGSLGILSANLTLNGPIKKDKGAIIISARRTFLEVMQSASKPFLKNQNNFFSKTKYSFYDLTAKASYKLSDKNRLFVTGYMGRDNYTLGGSGFDINNNMNWGNSTGAIRWNHTNNTNLIVNNTIGITNYKYEINADYGQYKINLASQIKDTYFNSDFTQLLNDENELKYGIHYTHHRLTPNNVKVLVEDINFNNTLQYYSHEFSPYLNSEIKLTNKLKTVMGIRLNTYIQTGPHTEYITNNTGQVSDSLNHSSTDIISCYFRVDPNLSVVYLIDYKSSIKATAAIKHQFIHLASVGSVSLPTDVWLPSTKTIKPQQVNIASIGYFRNFFRNTFESSIEVYYKQLKHQLEFKNGLLENFDNSKIEDNIVFGDGYSYGVELFLKKRVGKTQGWISYTWSKTNRIFSEINNGNPFPAKYDRTHDLSITLTHQISPRWSIASIFVYATGQALTLPVGRYIIQGNVANHYGETNSFRMPAYHRMDISATYQLKKRNRFESNINFAIYNIYNRSNTYFMFFNVSGDLENSQLSVKPEYISLFPILPAVTWNFKF